MHMRTVVCGFAAFLALFLALPSINIASAAGIEIGSVSRQQASATAIRDGRPVALSPNAMVHEDDELQTGPGARLELTLLDGTKLTMGENSTLVVDKFVYDMNGDMGMAIVNALKGPFRFVTGRIGKMANKQVQVQTAFATIGIRGTDFWAGPSAGVFGVFLVEGEIAVTNAVGETILNEPGTGVDLSDPNIAPGAVGRWSQNRVDAALASVAFN